MKRGLWLPTLVIALLIIVACAPKVAPGAAPAPAAPVPEVAPAAPSASAAPAPAKAAWEEEWEKWMAGAKREGKLVLYSTGGFTLRTGLVQGFKQRFGIDMEVVSGKGAEMAEKLMSERRAGLYLVDAYVGGATTVSTQMKPAGLIDPLKPVLILPEVLNLSAWRDGELRFLDAEERYHIAITAYSSPSMAINTELVKPGEINGYKDLLNPKWKGKIILNDPTMAGTGAKQVGMVGSRILNWDYWREMVKQEPIIVTDQRLMIEWVARGKYAVVIGIKPEIVEEFRRAGAPLGYVSPVEGNYMTSGSGTLCLINRAPHPNTAKVFVNWAVSKEGASVFSKALGVTTARLDVPTEGLDPLIVLKPGVKYWVSDDEKFTLEQPEQMKLAKEIFAPLLKK